MVKDAHPWKRTFLKHKHKPITQKSMVAPGEKSPQKGVATATDKAKYACVDDISFGEVEGVNRKGERVTQRDIDRIIALRASGASFAEIDRIIGRGKNSSRRILQRGLPKREKKWKLYADDFENGLRVRQIAEKYNVTEATVCVALDYLGLDKEVRDEYRKERPVMYRKRSMFQQAAE